MERTRRTIIEGRLGGDDYKVPSKVWIGVCLNVATGRQFFWKDSAFDHRIGKIRNWKNNLYHPRYTSRPHQRVRSAMAHCVKEPK